MSSDVNQYDKVLPAILRRLRVVSAEGWVRLAIILFVIAMCVGVALLIAYGPEWFA